VRKVSYRIVQGMAEYESHSPESTAKTQHAAGGGEPVPSTIAPTVRDGGISRGGGLGSVSQPPKRSAH